jgi:hypothetical protein
MTMKPFNPLAAGLAIFLAGVTAGRASAQAAYRPPVSPYINLNRQGTDPGLNFYGIVRPELRYNAAIPRLQQQVTTAQQAVSTLEASPLLPTTGHPFAFQSQGRYFQTLARQGQGQGLGGLPLRPMARPTVQPQSAPRGR